MQSMASPMRPGPSQQNPTLRLSYLKCSIIISQDKYTKSFTINILYFDCKITSLELKIPEENQEHSLTMAKMLLYNEREGFRCGAEFNNVALLAVKG
jgi:hypothetical protein